MNEGYHQIQQGTSPTSEHGSAPGHRRRPSSSDGSWKKRVSTACLACKKSKRKCSGTAPCENCQAFHRVCIFDESLDQRRRIAAKRTADELTYHRDLLNDLFKLIREADESKALQLLDRIRGNAAPSEIRGYLNETLDGLRAGVDGPVYGAGTVTGTGAEGGHRRTDSESVARIEEIRNLINVEDPAPAFRSKVMDIPYLCDEAPIKVPASPWTGVTEDADLVSHLVSLYFTWDYPFHAFLDARVFLEHMAKADLGSQFCSPFLVNALLSNACYFSEFSEAYVVPGDISSKGSDFLAEAERLRDEQPPQPSLASLQATLLMYERYAMSRNDDLGYMMLHEAIRMGEALGLVGDKGPRITSEQFSPEMDSSCRRTAWGLFNIDTLVHTGFLRPCLISHVNMPRLEHNPIEDRSLWRPYPTHRETRPSYLNSYFDEGCNLCTIARDISRSMFAAKRDSSYTGFELVPRQSREGLFERLKRWHDLLPDAFADEAKPPPHIILLKMRYHTLIINLFSCICEDEVADAPKTPESPPRHTPESTYNSWEVTHAAARGISALARLHRREYGVSRAHPFAMYAINLALFTMLEQESFDVLDQDFLSLASAFSIVASRSALGRNLFHIFRQSVRAKAQGDRIRDSSGIPADLQDLFDEDASNKGHTRFDEYADGLEKLNRNDKYHGIGGEPGQSLQDYPGLGLSDMLDRYESLSLGKDDVLSERLRPAGC